MECGVLSKNIWRGKCACVVWEKPFKTAGKYCEILIMNQFCFVGRQKIASFSKITTFTLPILYVKWKY